MKKDEGSDLLKEEQHGEEKRLVGDPLMLEQSDHSKIGIDYDSDTAVSKLMEDADVCDRLKRLRIHMRMFVVSLAAIKFQNFSFC